MKIYLNNFGKNFSKSVSEELLKLGLPECFGNMCPPIIQSIIDVPESEVLKNRDSVDPSTIAINDITNLVPDFSKKNKLYKNKIIDKDSLIVLEDLKRSIAFNYASKVKACIICEVREVCNQLTQNYINTIIAKGGLT